MKKLLFILLLVIACMGCRKIESRVQETKKEKAMYGIHSTANATEYHIEIIDEHQYIIFRCPYAISVIHSESCPCKQKRK